MSQLEKLLYLLSDPASFFRDNNDNEVSILRLTIFNIRLHIVIELIALAIFLITNIFINNQTTRFISEKFIDTNFIFYYAALLFVFLFVNPITLTTIEWFSYWGRPIHWLVKWATGKDDLLKIKRIVGYSGIFYYLLIHPFPIFLIILITKSLIMPGIIFGVVIVSSFIWQTIGIAKQYQLSWNKALFISFSPFLILIGIFGLIFLYIGLNLGFENMF